MYNCIIGTLFQELVARYVSLIPFVSDAVIFPGLCDIWSTCEVSKILLIRLAPVLKTSFFKKNVVRT